MKHTTKPKHTLTEITLLSESEFMHLEARHKKRFEYPLHHHTEIELNFVENYSGLQRIIGDSVEDCLPQCELILVGPQLEHCWQEGPNFVETLTHEITIQFSPKIFDGSVFHNGHFHSLMHMLDNCQQGICFSPQAIEHVRPLLDEICLMQPGFYRFQLLMRILYELSQQTDYRLLASENFASSHNISESQRMERVVEYIHKHYTGVIRLEDLSNLVYMSPTSFSHFFQMRTHKSVSDFIIDERIGHACRLLIDTNQTVQEICYNSGFQNISNFNRQFLKRRGCTPCQYRANYEHVQTPPVLHQDTTEKHPKLI